MKNIKQIYNKLSDINKKLYIVWWYTREKLLNWNYSWDIDLTTDALPSEMKGVLKIIKEVWKKYWTLVIIEWDETFEITTFRKDIWILDNRKPVEVKFTDSLESDSTRRDFTFNAIYFDVANDTYVDPQNWIADLKNWIIRFIWKVEDRINEDALRILRFIRFKNTYNFTSWDNNYFKILQSSIHLLKNISIERIKEEFEKILLLKNNIQALKDLKEIWFFELLISDINNLEKTPWWPNHHLEWNAWIHTLLTIEELNNIFKTWSKEYWIDINYSKQDKIDFYWTMLMHDIWKYDTYSKDKNWNIHYYGHEELSTSKAKLILQNFKFANNSSKKILWLIEYHLRIFKVDSMRKLKARKFMMNKFFKDLIIIWVADFKWKIPTDENVILNLLKFYKDFLIILKDKQFLTWNDILKKFPNLQWVEIKNKLNALNNEILIK